MECFNLIENENVLDHIGKTKTNNLLDEISKEYKENFVKSFPKYHELTKTFSIVSITEKEEIKQIGISCQNDLMTDMWGEMLQAILGGRNSTANTHKDTGGTLKGIFVYNNTDFFNSVSSGATGTRISIGKGLTPATRQDFKLESAFGVAPENQFVNTLDGVYNSGLGKITIPMTSFASGGSGAISETVLVGVWTASDPLVVNFILSRDNISPVVNFITGQTINVDYIMLLS